MQDLNEMIHYSEQYKFYYTLNDKILELIIIEKEPHKSGPQWKFVGSFYYEIFPILERTPPPQFHSHRSSRRCLHISPPALHQYLLH